MLSATRFKQQLWQGQLRFVDMSFSGSRKKDTATFSRDAAVWMDYLVMCNASQCCPILDHRFDKVLTPEQRELGDKLRLLLRDLSDGARHTTEFKMLSHTIAAFG